MLIYYHPLYIFPLSIFDISSTPGEGIVPFGTVITIALGFCLRMRLAFYK